MKALVLAGANIRLMPYLFGYFEQLSKLGYETTLFYWDRDGLKDRELPEDVESICFKKEMKNDIPKFAKLANFLKYRKAALKLLNSQHYDRVIVCDTQFAVLLSDVLLKKYKKRYIFDYRDPSYETIGIYKKRVAEIVLNSKATFISSDAYRENLPHCEYVYTTHNITMKDLQYRNIRKIFPRNVDKIRISFWGCIRDTDINLSLIKGLANDSRFELHYHGTIENTAKKIVEYCDKANIKNVFLHNGYLPDERYNFARETDIIHNMYNNGGKSNPSMGNKYYDGIIFYIPQICTEGGFMGLEAEKKNVGITINPTVPFADTLYNYYRNIEWDNFEKSCNYCLDTILKEKTDIDNVLRESLL